MDRNKKILSILIIYFYLVLLVPYIIASNAGEAGIVIDSQKIDSDYLTDDVRDLLVYKNESFNFILIEDQLKKVKDMEGTLSKENMLVISKEPQEKGSFIKIDKIESDMYVPNNIIPAVNFTFDKLIVGDSKKVKFGEVIEVTNYYGINFILVLSKMDFLAGGILVVLFLSYLRQKAIALWNISAMITCYSFQFFLVNMIASLNKLNVDSIILLFGFLFIPFLPLTFKTMKFEETGEGKDKILEYYAINNNIFKRINERIRMLIK